MKPIAFTSHPIARALLVLTVVGVGSTTARASGLSTGLAAFRRLRLYAIWMSVILAALSGPCPPPGRADTMLITESSGGDILRVTTGGAVSVFASGLNEPTGLAIDSSGNVFVNSTPQGTITEITPKGVMIPFASGLDQPFGMAFGPSGNLYVGELGPAADGTGPGVLATITPGGVISSFATGFTGGVADVAFTSTGQLYASNYATAVMKVGPGGALSLLADVSSPHGFAIDAAGNLLVAEYYTGLVQSITPSGVVSTYATELPGISDIAFDSSGTLYGVNQEDGTLVRFDPGGSYTTIMTGLDTPTFLKFLPQGSVPEPSPLVLLGWAGVLIGTAHAWRRRPAA